MQGRRFLGVLIILMVFFVWQCGKIKEAPDDLIGIWKTTAPKYADRSFEIKKDAITFEIGGGNFEDYAIKYIKTEKARDERSTLYTIHYKDEAGEEYTFAFYFYPEEGGVIRFKNQKQIVWTKGRDI